MSEQYKVPNLDDIRHHTEVGTGFTKDAMLNIAADWIEALHVEVTTLQQQLQQAQAEKAELVRQCAEIARLYVVATLTGDSREWRKQFGDLDVMQAILSLLPKE